MRLDEMSVSTILAELPYISRGNRIVLVIGAWLILSFVCLFWLWKPDLSMSTQLETTIQETLSRLNTQSALLLDEPLITAELQELESQVPILKKALPSERELASLLERINQTILDYQLTLSEFTPLPPIDGEVMRIVPVKLSVRGNGESISQLPNHIAKLSRQVSMKEFELSILPNSVEWQMTGQLKAYAQLPVNLTPEAGATNKKPQEVIAQ
jgi:Tfp pilus assembly protein PilO